MDEKAVIKVEENSYEDSCSVKPSVLSTVSKSVPTLLHQTDCGPFNIVLTIDKLVKSKRKQSLDRHLLRNCEESEAITHNKDALQTESSSLVQDQDAKSYQCEVCLSEGKKLKFYAKQTTLLMHMKAVHRPTPQVKCKVCSLTFTKAYLNTHLVRVHKYRSEKLNVKEYPCDMCSKVCYKRFELELHVVQAHVVDKPHECHICSKTFIDQEALSKHLKKHDRQPSHICDVCSKAFIQKTSLLRHLGVEHQKLFRCDECKKSFSKKSEFDAHSDPQLQSEYTCHVCKKTFPSQCNYTQHLGCLIPSNKLPNRNSDLKVKKIKESCGEFKCEQCLKTFDRQAYITAHRRFAHPNSPWPCSKCSRTFKKHYQMKRHEITHQEVKPCPFKLCAKSYRRQRDLIAHRKKSPSIRIRKRVQCPLCPTSFATSAGLIWHNRIFHGGKDQNISGAGTSENILGQLNIFKCPLCSTTFDRKNYFAAHRRLVHLHSRWPCSKCSGTFKTFTEMKEHELTHQEVKAHPCQFCPKSFHLPRDLKVHERSQHFKCQLCPESFAGRTRLKLHIANDHSGREKPFKCKLCDTSWVNATYLKNHNLLSHRTGKFFRCGSCPKSFKWLHSLKTHEWKEHGLSTAEKHEKVSRSPGSFVFVCNLCSFKTHEDKEVAAHYYNHGLPKVTLQKISDLI